MDLTQNALYILIILVFILLQFYYMRRRQPVSRDREIARSLLFDVRVNQDLTEVFRQGKLRKFETVSWRLNKKKVGFLAQDVQATLADTFATVDDINQQISIAKKQKSAVYTANIDVDKLKEPLAKCRQGIEEWLDANGGIKEPPPKYPSIFDVLFGGRRS
ncbi:MAG: hypothetical protein V1932_02490 [Chloroflexota bacterium]